MNKIMLTDEVDYIIASDTDSVYVTFDALVSKLFESTRTVEEKVNFLDVIGSNQFRKLIDESYQELADYTNAYDQKMFMDREAIADSTVFFAKKRYIMNVIDNEGVRYKTPKIKMMGIEVRLHPYVEQLLKNLLK
jgi:DNA polymerase elongation subunit (family B)